MYTRAQELSTGLDSSEDNQLPFIYLLNHRRVPNPRAPHTPTASSTRPGNHTEELSNDARISRAARPTYREHREARCHYLHTPMSNQDGTHMIVECLNSLATFSPRESKRINLTTCNTMCTAVVSHLHSGAVVYALPAAASIFLRKRPGGVCHA